MTLGPPTPTTLGELRASGYATRSVRQEIRENLLERMRGGKSLFEGVSGYDETVVPAVENALLCGHDLIFLGERGQAKTRMIRQLVGLLDPWIPTIAGAELHDDPFAPITAHGRDAIERHGDATPIEWAPRDARYVEKLATPDVSVADLIGDVDPIKVAEGRSLSDEHTIHFGLVPRTHRGIFCINELPDLTEKVQVGLFNVMEERDVQIKGYRVRLPIDVLVVPIGGGGLIAGCAIAAKAKRPGIEVLGVEAEMFPSMHQALAGLPIKAGGPTLAEGIAVKSPGTLTLPVVRDLVTDIALVGEVSLERAVAHCLESEKLVVEGAGAAGIAALMADPKRFAGRSVGLMVCGGNIDSRLLSAILMRTLIRDGRIGRLRIEINDRPGALAAVTEIIARQEGNIVEVSHQRLLADMPAKLAELEVLVETRDAEHLAELVAAMEAAGYPVTQPAAIRL